MGGDRLAGSGLCRSIALVELAAPEGLAINEKSLDPSGSLRKRLAQDRRAAFACHALARRASAGPVDFTGNDPPLGGSGKLRAVTGGGGRCRGEDRGANNQSGAEHCY